MIGLLHGTVVEIREKEILILTESGVGYVVFPAGSLLAMCKKGAKITTEIFTVVKETEISLYGFGDSAEKYLFQKLLAVSGIGPKTAIQMVSIPVARFMSAVENGDLDVLTEIPGLGKKTAQRLIVELHGKLDLSNNSSATPLSPSRQEATDALVNLGYDKPTINSILKEAPQDRTAEELVKYFLSSNA